MYYYNEIKNKLVDNKVYLKEKYKVITYFEIGKLLSETGGKPGNNIIKNILQYNKMTLFRMK